MWFLLEISIINNSEKQKEGCARYYGTVNNPLSQSLFFSVIITNLLPKLATSRTGIGYEGFAF